MKLRLQDVAPHRGLHWVRQGFANAVAQPLGYAALFAVFMMAVILVGSLPVVGGLLLLASVPLLGLGFTMAAVGAARGVRVHPAVFVAPWRGAPAVRRQRLIVLCLGYAVVSQAVLSLCGLIDGGSLDALMVLAASGQADPAQIDAALDAPGLVPGVMARLLLSTLVAIPYWHAAPLVHWGDQGVAQSLFSSVLALWRNRGAFLLYGLGWAGVALAGAGVLLLAVAVGLPASLLALPLSLLCTVAFYASLHPCFTDCFAVVSEPADAAAAQPDSPSA